VTWFHNREIVETHSYANITFYKLRGVGYGWRVGVSLPKFAKGQNVDLLLDDEINSTLAELSAEVSDTCGLYFDSFGALTARVDYSTNLCLPASAADPFFDRIQRLNVARMPRQADLSRDRSIYHGNGSRMLKTYDKSAENNSNNGNGGITVRMEYMLAGEESVSRFAKRLKLPDYRAATMVSADVRRTAIDELYGMLHLATFDPTADYSVKYFFNRTRNINVARRCSSFVAAYNAFGPNFDRLPDIQFSHQRYIRELKECEKYGF
jgi:hypothetical protein